MIFAGSFAGDGAQEDAAKLALEMRKRWQLPSYTYSEHYDFRGSVDGLGLTPDGQRLQMKHRLPIEYDEVAVLIGNFPTFNDPKLQQVLHFVKHCQPAAVDPKASERPSTLRYAGLRAFHRKLTGDKKKLAKGPLGQAFATRNPLLPEEFFSPKGIDPLVQSMNHDVKHSLLRCPGRYSVRIATFSGTVVIDQQRIQQIEQTGRMEARLAQAAEKAHELTERLRQRGIEAYEFHDRHESLVTVGSFSSVGTPRADGKTEINPAILRIMQTYGAEQRALPGQALAGLMPKSIAGITLDVQPIPVEVPRDSIARAYDRSNSLLR